MTEDTTTQTSLLDKAGNTLRSLFNEGNKRRLELRNPKGQTVLGLGLVWAIALAAGTLFLSITPLLLISTIVLILMKYQFVVTRTN